MTQKKTIEVVEESVGRSESVEARDESKPSKLKRLKKWSVRHRMILVPALALLIVAVLFVIPATRYQLVGSFVEKTVVVRVVDSQKGEPVSQAKVELDGQTVLTDKDGHVQLKSRAGFKRLVVTKQYFKDSSSEMEVKLFSDASAAVSLEATGRLTPVHVKNRVTGEPVVNALVDAGNGNTVQTDESGNATIVLPAATATAKVRVITVGYLTASGAISQDGKNELQIVPAGVIYFLSNQSGKIDVVKANLDGSGRKIVYAGTGTEDQDNTSLLASRDWRYLVLQAKRTASKPASLYLIDTKTDEIEEIDSGNVNFSLIGWSDHRFFYTVNRNDKAYNEAKVEALKSINAETRQLTTHDENEASANGAYSYLGNSYIIESGLVYTHVWSTADFEPIPADKKSNIMLIPTDGSQKKTLKSFQANNVSYLQASLYEPQEIYFQLTDSNDKKIYLELDDSGISTVESDESSFNRRYPTFIVSPTGKNVIWREVRDGKNTIFIGDKNAESKQQIVTASEFTPYGWLTDDYILLQKDDSELYIIAPDQLNAGVAPLKIGDYYKSPNDYYGYGYGYGGQ